MCGAVLLAGVLPVLASAAEVRLLERTLDAAGGRVTVPGISVDCSLGALGNIVVSGGAPAVRLQGGLPGRLNEPPRAPDQIWHRPVGLSVKRRVSELLAPVADAERDLLELVEAGPPGLPAVLRVDHDWLLYAPPEGGGDDQFRYVVVDPLGGRGTATVYVLLGATGQGPSQNQLGAPVLLPDGGWLLRFLGLPGRTYLLQYTDDLADSWLPVPGMPAPWRAPADGLLEAVDHGGTVPTRFYRVVMVF